MTLKVIENGTIRKLECGFIFTSIELSRYLLLFARYSELIDGRVFSAPAGTLNTLNTPSRNFAKMFDTHKTRMIGLVWRRNYDNNIILC